MKKTTIMPALLFAACCGIVGAAALSAQDGGDGAPVAANGYAAMDEKGVLAPFRFMRRPVGDRDLLVEILTAACATATFTKPPMTGITPATRMFRDTKSWDR